MIMSKATNIIIVITMLAALSNPPVAAQTCPTEWFNSVITIIGEQKVSVSLLGSRDTEGEFLATTLAYGEDEIQQLEVDVITFFNSTHGLDFSQSLPNELGERQYQNATLYLFEAKFDLQAIFNCWLVCGNIAETQCYRISLGGYTVQFSGPQMLYGTYGGEEGKPVNQGDVLGYQFYSIPVCEEMPIVLQFQTVFPVRYEAIDGHTLSNMEIYHPSLGKGRLSGVFGFFGIPDEPGFIHIVMRAVITFPDTPSVLQVKT